MCAYTLAGCGGSTRSVLPPGRLRPAKQMAPLLLRNAVLLAGAPLRQAWLTFATHALGFNKLFPGVDPRVLTLSLNFHGPILREYLLLHGVCE